MAKIMTRVLGLFRWNNVVGVDKAGNRYFVQAKKLDRAFKWTNWLTGWTEEAAIPKALAQEKISNVQKRAFSSYTQHDDISSEEGVEDAERGAGWLLKLFFAGTATFVGLQFLPFMGENVMQQSVALLRVKDPMFKRMGASRLSRFAYNDDKRRRIVELGGIAGLINMLESATDDCTRREAMKALASLSVTDTAIEALHDIGAHSMISSIAASTADDDILKYRSILMKQLNESEFLNNDGKTAVDV